MKIIIIGIIETYILWESQRFSYMYLKSVLAGMNEAFNLASLSAALIGIFTFISPFLLFSSLLLVGSLRKNRLLWGITLAIHFLSICLHISYFFMVPESLSQMSFITVFLVVNLIMAPFIRPNIFDSKSNDIVENVGLDSKT